MLSDSALRRLVAQVACVALMAATVVTAAQKLSPNCGSIDSTSLNAQQVSIFSIQGTGLEISCFSTLVVSTIPANCNATNVSVVLQVLAVNGQAPIREIDMTALMRGSVYSIVVEQPQAVQFNIVARYPAWHFCPATLYHSIYGTYTTAGAQLDLATLTAVQPDVVDVGIPVTFTLQTVKPFNDARVLILDEGTPCSTNAASAWPQVSNNTAIVLSATTFQWTTTVAAAGQYRLCVWTSASSTWAVTALFQAYGGQPAYFKSQVTAQTNTGETDRFVFYGEGLDARRDRLKLIDDDGVMCSEDAQSSKTAVAYGPYADLQYPDRTIATIDFTYVWGGASYKVCYYVASLTRWNNVPDFDSMTREVTDRYPNQLPDSSSSSAGQLTCSTAPYDADNVAPTTSQAVQLTIGGTRMPTSLDTILATYLCILPEEISIVEFKPGTLESKIVFQVHCTTSKCNDAERQAAFTSKYPSLAIPNLEKVQLILWTGVDVDGSGSGTGDGGTGSDPVHDGTVILGIGVGLSILLVAITGIAICIVKKRSTARLVHGNAPRVVEGAVIPPPNPNLTYTSGEYTSGYVQPVVPPPSSSSSQPSRRRDRAAVDVDHTEVAVPMTELSVPLTDS